jgi:hypothetical protein
MTDEIHIGDLVTSSAISGVHKVVRTRNTVGIMRPQDEMLLQNEDGSGATQWDARGNLYLLKKAQIVESPQ